MKDQLFLLLKKLLVKNSIQINEEELLVQLSSHPSYPSLHAVIGVLDHFNIPNIAVRLNKDVEILNQLPKNFMAVTEKDLVSEICLVQKTSANFKLIGDDGKKRIKSVSAFLEAWNGIIIAIEKDENIVETKKPLIYKVLAFTPYTLGAILAGYFISQSHLYANLHFALSALGLFLSVLLVKQDLGLLSKAANSFCNISEKTSCDAILQSKGATFFGVLKLSDISVVAFIGYIITWFIFLSQGVNNLSSLFLLSILALPFVAYSLYYQGVVLKKWCPLCLGVVGVLLLQAASSFFAQDTQIVFSEIPLALCIAPVVMLLTLSIWLPLKSLFQKNKKLKTVEIDHLKFKNNFAIFNVLLEQGTYLKNSSDIPSEIILGNPNATLTLTLVTSPFCHYCKQAHQDITQLLDRAGDKIKIRIRFNVSTKNKDTDLYIIVSHVLETFNKEGADSAAKLLHTLYADAIDLKKWIDNNAIQPNDNYIQIMDDQSNWAEENGINFTPALFIGDKPFPKEYGRLDLLNFIDALIEEANQTTTTATNKIAS